MSHDEKEDNYDVYELLNGEYHHLAYCVEASVARAIAICLAALDAKGDAYYVTPNSGPGDWVPGGGCYDCYRKGADGKVTVDSLS